MNLKTAKRLRRIATAMAVGAEQKGQQIPRARYYIQNGSVILDTKSWKGMYRALKKGLRGRKVPRNQPLGMPVAL